MHQFSACFLSVFLHYFTAIHFKKNKSLLTEDLRMGEVEKGELIYYMRATVLLVVSLADMRFMLLCINLTSCLHGADNNQTLAIQ